MLTGETFPVEKEPSPVEADASLPERLNMVFMGTSARSGTARALIVETGTRTEYGRIAERLTLRPPAGLTAVYVLFAEITKKLFYRRLTW